jgi:hypothetical protein
MLLGVLGVSAASATPAGAIIPPSLEESDVEAPVAAGCRSTAA